MASLLRLSVADPLSPAEKARLDRAGNEPNEVRRALLEIHELRLAYARHDLQEAQAQRAALGYTSASPLAAQRAKVVREQEQVAAVKVARYADAVSTIQSWHGGSVEQDAAADLRTETASTKTASSTEERGQSSQNPAAGPVSPPKAVSTQSAHTTAADMPRPSAAEVAESAKHPTMTVYADEGAAVAGPEPAPAPDRARDQAEIRATLQRWAQSMMLNDPRAEIAEYSSHMDRYFLYRNVDRSFVEADKAAYLRQGNITARFTTENVHFDRETPDSADISLVKDVAWQRSRDGSTRKLIRSRLHLVRTEQGWKIAGEQDLR